MADNDQATGDGALAPGAESSPAAIADPNAAAVQAPSDQGTSMPDERYKGMQRELQREKDRAAQLERQVQEAASSGGRSANGAIITVLRELAATGPEGQARAQALAMQIDAQQTREELEATRQRQAWESQNAQFSQLRESNMAELRAVARDMGADPESSLVDYGNDDQPLYERIKRVRESAKQATKPATPTAAPTPTANTTHNTQPGVAPAPASKSGPVTEDDVEAAMAAYSRKPTPENMKALQEINDKFQETF